MSCKSNENSKNYFERYALPLQKSGYDIVPIRPGQKRPFGREWQATIYNPKRIASTVESGRGKYGVGVKTRMTPMVDIDCYDSDLVDHMIEVTEDLCGETLKRIGLAPKTGLVYRAKKPFPKTQSKVFIDDEGRSVKLEVLGDGQQFVAFHVHPDTGKPYKWLGGESILDVERSELNVIDQDDALELVAEFERQARKRGWKEKNTVKRLTDGRPGRERNYDDPFITDKAKVDLSAEKILKELHKVPNADEYETWFHIGMALFHQFDGSQEGLDMWHEWSSQAPNYEMDVLDDKWDTFNVEGKKREPITARFILKLAKEEDERLAGEELDEINDDIKNANDHRDFQTIMDKVKHIAFPPMLRESIVVAIKDQTKKVMGSTMPVGLIRRGCAFENPENRAKPAWLREWVYVQQDDTFYNSKTRQTISTKGFDLSFGRFLLTKKDILEGISTPEHSASHVAVHRYQIATVANKMYAPGEDQFFEANKLLYVNNYSDATVPEDVPERLTPKQLKMCQRIEAHTEHLCSVERDRKLLLSWLAYIVQTGGKVNWSIVIQGVEGDGKSFFGRMMAAVLGGENVDVINGDQLAEQYTPWAEGSQFLMVEEVRLHGHDRFAVINKLKPYITNDMVTVRRMRTDSYKVFNTVNYFLTTNHKDGVPVNENSSRYFPIFSRWQTKGALAEFNKTHPDYYSRLHTALKHPGALRRWFLDYKLHEEFDPRKRAPDSGSMREMRYLNQTDEQDFFSELLTREKAADLTPTLIDSKKAWDALSDLGISPPRGRAWKNFLSSQGLTYLGEHKVQAKNRNYWSERPERFQNDYGDIDPSKIRNWINSGWENDI